MSNDEEKNRSGSRGGGQDLGTQAKGFFGALFEISFQNFVTTRIVSIIYVIAIVVAGLSALGNFIFGISLLVSSTSAFVGAGVAVLGIVVILLTPVVFIVEVIVARVLLETVIVLFRIAENTGGMLRER